MVGDLRGLADKLAVRGEDWIPNRYPYTYACDYLRQNPDVVPDDVRHRMQGRWDGEVSRADASLARSTWAIMYKFKDEALAKVLADQYMADNNIRRSDREG